MHGTPSTEPLGIKIFFKLKNLGNKQKIWDFQVVSDLFFFFPEISSDKKTRFSFQ